MTFSEKLKKTMQELHLNQSQVCGLTGKSKGSVSQYLSGKQIPSEKAQSDIAVSLGLAPDYFTAEEQTLALLPKNDDVRMTIKEAAALMHVHYSKISRGLQQGVFPWGYGVQNADGSWWYFINRKRFMRYEVEGVICSAENSV